MPDADLISPVGDDTEDELGDAIVLMELYGQLDAEQKRLYAALPKLAQKLRGETDAAAKKLSLELSERSEKVSGEMGAIRASLDIMAEKAGESLAGLEQRVAKHQAALLAKWESEVPAPLVEKVNEIIAQRFAALPPAADGKAGVPGAPGQPGKNASIIDNFRGEFSSKVSYASGDVFTFLGGTYLVLKDAKGVLPNAKSLGGKSPTYAVLAAPGGGGGGNSGVTSLKAGANITLSATTGDITISASVTGGGATGNVSVSGTPNAGDMVQWTNPSSIQGIPFISVTKGGTGLTTIAASRLLWSTATDTLGVITVGNSINVSGATLDTVQDIRTTAAPLFTRLALGSASASPRGFFIKQTVNDNTDGFATARFDNNNFATVYIGSDNGLYSQIVGAAGAFQWYTNLNTRCMQLDGTGNLRVFGTQASTSVTSGSITAGGGAGFAGAVYAGSFQGPIGTAAASTGKFTSLTLNNFTITASGGATLNDWFDQSVKTTASPTFAGLSVSGDIGMNGSGATRTITGGTTLNIATFSSPPNTMNLQTAGSTWLSINGVGTVRMLSYGAGAASFDSSGNLVSASDARLKNIIGDFKGGLAELLKLTPKRYTWRKETGLNTEDLNVSLIAQDLIAAGLSEAVFTQRTVTEMEDVQEDDGKTVARAKLDANGDAITRKLDSTYTVSDRAIIAALVNAVKELASKNDALEARLVRLEKLFP